MKHFPKNLIASALTLALLAPMLDAVVAQTPSSTTASQHYVMTDLNPVGATNSAATGMSAVQQVGSAGFPTAAGLTETHAVLWSGSADSVVDLGIGSISAVADGQQVGTANNQAALWSGSAASLVNLNPDLWTQSVANGIATGQQVGIATRSVLCGEKKGACSGGTSFSMHPFMWSGSAASAVDLTPFGIGFGAGNALDTDGLQQVGYGQQLLGVNAFSGPFAVVWSGTAASAVNLNPANSIESQAKAVLNGQQVGYAFSPHRAVLWTGSAASVQELNPVGFISSEANATNGLQQVGFGLVMSALNVPTRSHALVWSGSATSVIDLNQFLPIGFTESAATGIDQAGNIVGWASKGSHFNAANVHAVMWKLSAAPDSFAQSINLDQQAITPGQSVQATVTLNQPAPVGGAVVNLANTILPAIAPPALTVDMPASITIAEGAISASFTVATGLRSLAGFAAPYGVDIQASYGDTTQTATLIVNPPVFLSSLNVAPGNIVTGSTAVGTLILNAAAPAGGALVTLSSNNPAATVPANVLVPAGQTFATFNLQANPVTTFTTVTITGSYGSAIAASASATLIVAPPAPVVDTVAIQKADYVVSKKQLVVQASSTSQTAMLTVSVSATGQIIGILTNKGAGTYSGTFSLPASPQNITVTSDLSGASSKAVTLK